MYSGCGSRSRELADFDEDAFAGAFLGGVDGCFVGAFGHGCQPTGATGVVNGVAVFYVGKSIIEQSEDIGRNLDADAIAGA